MTFGYQCFESVVALNLRLVLRADPAARISRLVRFLPTGKSFALFAGCHGSPGCQQISIG